MDINRLGYDQWSQTYDYDVNSTVAADERAFPKFWQGLSPRRVLEIGCGTGRHTQRLARDGHEVVGIDLSKGMLKIAHQKLSGFDNVRLIEGDLFSLNLTDLDQFDLVICALVLEHIADLDRFFRCVHSVMTQNSTFYLSEIHPNRISNGSQARFTDLITGETCTMQSYVHLPEAIIKAAQEAGLSLKIEDDYSADEDFCAQHDGWDKYCGMAMVRIWGFGLANPVA